MKRLRSYVVTSCVITCVSASSEPPAWLDDWYEIEVIIFIQPDSPSPEITSSTPSIYTENLIVAAPTVLENVTHTFPLTETERTRILKKSHAVDLEAGTDPWFIPAKFVFGIDDPVESPRAENISPYGRFPDWMLPPGDSYDVFFTEVFSLVPFGDWFAVLSLASLIEKQEEEQEEHLEDGEVSDRNVTQESNETADEREITREEILTQIDTYREELERTSYIMDEQNVRLPRTAARLRSEGVHVVKHFNWHQYVPPFSTRSEYVFFQSLEEYPTEGYFGISKGRFIHFDVRMWIHQTTNSSEVRNPVYELAELRRMQREDVHYFDHPKFGILAEVVKVEFPPDLQELWDSLN
ncbi:MAG: CsiV family protein [Gammaproteobacteria bacterium]|nr:CsiV family protein [Gammaproteobacteria bacterium]